MLQTLLVKHDVRRSLDAKRRVFHPAETRALARRCEKKRGDYRPGIGADASAGGAVASTGGSSGAVGGAVESGITDGLVDGKLGVLVVGSCCRSSAALGPAFSGGLT
jgi:hypothetical protein